MNQPPDYFRYWGKAEKDGPGYHLLAHHCLDVAAVGWFLFDPVKPFCQRIAKQLEVDPAWLQGWVTFCLSLHDVGKFSTAFQGIVPALSPLLVPSNKRMPYTIRHDTLGFHLWQDILFSQWLETGGLSLDAQHSQMQKILRNIRPWVEIVTGHHGEPPNPMPIHRQNFFTVADEEAANHFREAAAALFLGNFDISVLANKTLKTRLKLSSWLLAGEVVLADWLGSGRSPASYCQTGISLDEYWQSYALPHAEQALSNANLSHSAVAPFAGTVYLFPFIRELTPLQVWAEERQFGKGNQFFILEDVTGAGKTEAALVLAHRLMANGLAEGIYVALPTMATSNAMYTRLGKAYRRLFGEDARPSLVLAHGSRHLSEEFRCSVGLPDSAPPIRSYSEDEEPTETYCSAWLADSRKKALLAEVGVGTLDQALLSVLPARHQCLRLLGLAQKVLIVDEVHSYDPYMNQLLQTLIEAHARQGGTIILLSATLPGQMREKYVRAFCEGADIPIPKLEDMPSYPLATHVPSMGHPETHLKTRVDVERSIAVTLIADEDEVLNVIREAVEKGECVCWVRNTVNDARTAYRLLSSQEWSDKSKLMLFHSRFTMMDRQRIETATLNLFDKESTAEKRRGQVLIATQVVEQSLDLDFDVMISDLAPIDLLIQRAGRLRRHVRDIAGNPLPTGGATDQRGEPCLYVFGPEPTNEPTEEWLKASLPGTQAVYQHVGQLWLTQQLCSPGKISMPGDARLLIEGVYSEDAQGNIPETLLGLCWNAEGAAGSKRGMARLNALKLEMGYTRASAEDSGGWDKETRIPTRLGDDSITVALVRLEEGSLKPYAETSEFVWELSMIDLPKNAWRKAQERIPSSLRGSIDKLKEEVKLLKWVEVMPLTEELSRYYDPQMGWGSKEEESDESNK